MSWRNITVTLEGDTVFTQQCNIWQRDFTQGQGPSVDFAGVDEGKPQIRLQICHFNSVLSKEYTLCIICVILNCHGDQTMF